MRAGDILGDAGGMVRDDEVEPERFRGVELAGADVDAEEDPADVAALDEDGRVLGRAVESRHLEGEGHDIFRGH